MIDLKVKKELKNVKINRLFLIGNGFDLSLGLKTKYTDFLLWLLKKQVAEALKSGVDRAPFPKYKVYDKLYNENVPLKVIGFSSNELFDILIQYSLPHHSIVEPIDSLNDFFEFINRNKIEIKTPEKSLMEELIKISKENWVDIENTYFDFLKKIIKNNLNKSDISKSETIDKINDELSKIIFYLKEYLINLNIKIENKDALKYFNQFNEDLNIDDFLEINSNTTKLVKNVNYFLNFNYTDSISKVLSFYDEYNYIQNFIHGNLNDDELIFGFGDEMDQIYKEIEELNDNRFFKHIKSFHYFKTSKQRQLQSFLNSESFQVCIYGHSCGLSDRVMLNEIFEHENCKSIKIYYYSDEDFTYKTMEISRHFNSNQNMRKKIVNKNSDCMIPQIN
jgi:hypothetical protein